MPPQEQEGTYAQKIAKMIANNESRLIVNLNDLRSFQAALAREYVRVFGVGGALAGCASCLTHGAWFAPAF